MNVSFFSDLLSTISERGRGLIGLARGEEHARATVADLVKLSNELISRRGEASGVALARIILDRYSSLPQKDRFAYLIHIAADFGSDEDAIERAVESYRKAPTRAAAHALHEAAEPKSQELIRRLNLAAGGTLSLVRMREDLIDLFQTLRTERSDAAIAVESLDQDFVHLFSSWFNRGFLVLRRIDWGTPAIILEKIIRYEAVHRIRGWDDLRRRIDPPDRRCYAFFHPALIDDPLIFVEVALNHEIPTAIAPILTSQRESIQPDKANTAVFYSISNCQRGLAGVTFGHFLIKQVAEEISREIPNITRFVTLSPVPGFAEWLTAERAKAVSPVLDPDDRAALANLDTTGWWQMAEVREPMRAPLLRAAAWYFLHARNRQGVPRDPVARFHLGNGARLEQIDWLADTSSRGLSQSHGLMVNYLYDLKSIEKNHEAFAETRTIVTSSAVRRLARSAPAETVPATG
jgi:malonyl-CoA decarboxylase